MTAQNHEHERLRPFVQAPAIDAAEHNVIKLDAIDLSRFEDGPAARRQLADQLEKTITTSGFFNVVNFGYAPEKLEHLKAVAQSLVEIPDKEHYLSGAATAEQDLANKSKGLGAERGEGFKPRGFWKMTDGVRDSIVHFNFRDAKLARVFEQKCRDGVYPPVFARHWRAIHDYYVFLHEVVLRKVLTLCDIILGLPEDTMYSRFFPLGGSVEDSAGGHGRFMMYYPLAQHDAAQVDGTWLRGHSDISAFSIITAQPILLLQIRDPELGQWKYVDYRADSLVCNVGDAMEFLTGGYFKASIHRVQLPPAQQRQYQRLVLIDFVNPLEDTVVHPASIDSAKLKHAGLQERPEWDRITYRQWDDVKGKLLGADGVGDRSKLVYFGRNIERWHNAPSNLHP